VSDKFQVLATEQLAHWVFTELGKCDSIFGIPRAHFFVPRATDRFRTTVYGQPLETPFGVAAGPHSQMAQNIIAAWLCGARFIELKTVQTLDELDVSKPCIDLEDEGYNVEWSQELKVHESFAEYLRAWVLIHALHRKLGLPGDRPGMIFNMSVGYNLEGILKPNVQWYLDRMGGAPEELARCVDAVAVFYPDVRKIAIPDRMSDNVTLSTMHGCPPEEIEKISLYLINDRGLHTNVKLNPTLLGPERLREILNRITGYREVVVPDAAFGHDLKYADALGIIRNLSAAAAKRGVQFGVKLSNTLEVENWRDVFNPKEKMMYMSGRALHAVTVNLAARLAAEFHGGLMMSFSAGADAFNVARLLAAGMRTITVCSDILKTGGYMRLTQYVEQTAAALTQAGAAGLDEYIQAMAGLDDSRAAALANLQQYAQAVLAEPRLKKGALETDRSKTNRKLDWFDCIMAPCTDECPVNQQVPQYMRLVREGRLDEAIAVTRDDNPLPAILGRACNHFCEFACVRTHLDDPLAIREMKRFIMDAEKTPRARPKAKPRNVKVAVVGGGPCGLSIAYFLSQAGYAVTVFEARAYVGGMVAGTIPGYRATQAAIDQDLRVLRDLGVELRCNQQAGRDFTLAELRRQNFKYIALTVGAQRGMRLGVPGEDSAGVRDALDFLRDVREGHPPQLGEKVAVVGGGDTALDCARTAWRLTGRKVTVLYRRTIGEMPADREERTGALDEGIAILELVKPLRVIAAGGRMPALECRRMKLGDKDASGRRRPVDIPGTEFQLPLDDLIVAIGQQAELDFLGDEPVRRNKSGYLDVNPETFETAVPNLYAGGDIASDGPASIVRALGDGRRIANDIRRKEEKFEPADRPTPAAADAAELIRRKARREFRVPVPERPAAARRNFDEVVATLAPETAAREASRCLECDRLCSICATVCPNRAILTYAARPFKMNLPALRKQNGHWVAGAGPVFSVEQAYQILIVNDFCNECGNCATFCPTAGRPYKDKPRFYLRHQEFEAEKDNAFMLIRAGAGGVLRARFGGRTHELALNDNLTYRPPGLEIALDPATLEVREIKGEGQGGSMVLHEVGPMYALLRSVLESVPYLPGAEQE